MNGIRKTIAAAICAGALAACGCASETGSSTISETAPYSDSESSAVSAFEIPGEAKNSETPYITYLGTGEPDSVTLSTYARTAGLSDPKSAVTVMYVGDYSYEDRLSELINADESPDLTDKRPNTFPYLMSRNVYEDLAPFIDAAAPQWEGFSEHIERYSFKGARYFYPTTVTIAPQFLVYDKMRFVQFNITDPERLWENGEWTWAALSESAEKLREHFDEPTAMSTIGGELIFENMLAAALVPLIDKLEGGQFTWNIYTGNYAETEDFFFSNVCDSSLTAARALSDGQAAFLSADESVLGSLRSSCPDLNIGVVPYPKRNSELDGYYCKAVTDGYLVPKGAKNVRSAASFINCSRIAAESDDGHSARCAELKRLGLLRSDIEWIEQFRYGGDISPVLVEGECLDKEANAAIRELYSSYDNVGEVYFGPDISAIDKCIMGINALL